MENTKLKAALKYRNLGFSVIPVGKDKTPFFQWAKYQTRKASLDEIKQWWAKWPEANVAIVTGQISGMTVIDADSKKGLEALKEYLPDDLITPVSKTPKGWHYFFKYTPALSNSVRVIEDCDLRNNGGYVVAPPSINNNGSYSWIQERNSDTTPAHIPGLLLDILKNNPYST